MKLRRKPDITPIVFEIQKDYNEDLQAIRYLKDWIHQVDACLLEGKITEEDRNREMRIIDNSIRKLEEKYGICQSGDL